LRASFLDCSALNLLQDLLHLGKRVKDHEWLVARPDAEHRPSVATEDLLGNPLDQPGVIEAVFRRGFMARSYLSTSGLTRFRAPHCV
jgi:hypothetical protein